MRPRDREESRATVAIGLRGLAALLLPLACSAGAPANGGSGVFGSTATATASEADADASTADGDDSSGNATDGATETSTSNASADGSTGASASEDSGVGETAAAVCGDDNLQPGEDCDGMSFGDVTCASLGFDDGVLACDPECHVLSDACFTCGDGEIALSETCDGTNFDGETCATLGFLGGALSCTADCSELVTTQCQPLPSCGDGEQNGGELCDGNDLGAASCISQGFDMGNLACTESCTLDTSGCMDDLKNCGMMGDFCIFSEDDIQSTCCPAGVGGNVLGICDIFVCV